MIRPRITVIGSSNTDMVVLCNRLPAPGETVLGGRFLQAAGGKGANQAVAAARAGGDVTFVAKLGRDIYGDAALEGFERDGVRCEWIIRDAENPSGIALILVNEAGENLIAVAPGANGALSPVEVERSRPAIEDAEVLLLQLEVPLNSVYRAIEIAHGSRVRVLLNPAPAPREPIPPEILGKVSILTPNESELEILSGRSTPSQEDQIDACRSLLAMGVEAVVLTRGVDGVLVVSRNGVSIIRAFPVRAVDTVGAGDCFAGCLAVALAGSRSFDEACRFAMAGAAISVTREGAQPSLPYRREIEDFMMSRPQLGR